MQYQEKENAWFWLEAQDFTDCNFMAKDTPEWVYANPKASAGCFVVAFQKNGQFLEYSFKEEVDGLHSCNVWLRYATTAPESVLEVSVNGRCAGTATLPGSGDFFHNFRWAKLAQCRWPKGNHALRLTLHSGVIHPDVIVLTYGDESPEERAERRIAGSPALPSERFQLESFTTDRLWVQHHRNGMPLGGIGTGKVELCPDGTFVNISTNNNQDAPIAGVRGCFFAWRGTGGAIRRLEGSCWQLRRADYPVLELSGHHDGIDCELTAFGPMTPYDEVTANTPGALFGFRLANTGNERRSGEFGLAWENLIGCGGIGLKPEFGPGTAKRTADYPFHTWNDRTGNDQEVTPEGLRFFSHTPDPYGSSGGEYMLASNHPACRFTRSFNVEAGPEHELATPGEEGKVHPGGIVWVPVDLAPGATMAFDLALAWHFPVWRDRLGRDFGVRYTSHFSGAAQTAQFLLSRAAELEARVREVPALLRDSSLPEWLAEKIINDQFPLTACTWYDAENHFAVNEAPAKMHGCLGTIDQRTSSQGVYTSLFPALDRNELELFAHFQAPNGGIPHDLGHGMIDPERNNHDNWPDLAAAFILQFHRYVHGTGDMDFFRRHFDRIERAIAWVLHFDDDGDGIPDMKPGRGNSYDSSEWPGCSAYIATTWIAGLAAAEDLARLAGRADQQLRYRQLRETAIATAERRLWNGRYYRNFDDGDGNKARPDGENCLLPQLAGEWAAALMHLPSGYGTERIRTAAAEIWRRNLQPFPGPADETTPEGKVAGTGAAFLQYSWLYFGAMANYYGLTEEAAASWRQAWQLQYEINQQPWKTYLCAFAGDGRFNGLPWYMSNTASWYILNALSGFAWSIPDRWLAIDPKFAASWGDTLRIPLFGSNFTIRLDYTPDSVTLTPLRRIEGLRFAEVRLRDNVIARNWDLSTPVRVQREVANA